MKEKKITREELPLWFQSVADLMEEQSVELCQMDARMGDGDLGLTMRKGFAAVCDFLQHSEEEDIGKCLAKAGMHMAATVPSTMGTLMASGLMEGGKNLVGKTDIGARELAAFFTGVAAGVQKRGKCQTGDCTVYDSLFQAAEAAQQMTRQLKPTVQEVAQAAMEGAIAGVEATRSMHPKFGKAAVFAGQAEGIADQGAVAGELFVRGLGRYLLVSQGK